MISAEVMFNRETHKSRGFGFIVFELEKGAEQVCAEREHLIDGKVVSITHLCDPDMNVFTFRTSHGTPLIEHYSFSSSRRSK